LLQWAHHPCSHQEKPACIIKVLVKEN
jgi:hypothetical protein